MLGFFLCINNFGLGIGAALTGLNIYLTSITCLILSIFFIELGCRLTYNLLSQNTVKYAEYVASIMIILLALYQLISWTIKQARIKLNPVDISSCISPLSTGIFYLLSIKYRMVHNYLRDFLYTSIVSCSSIEGQSTMKRVSNLRCLLFN